MNIGNLGLINLGTVDLGTLYLKAGSTTTFNHPLNDTHENGAARFGAEDKYGLRGLFMEHGAKVVFGPQLSERDINTIVKNIRGGNQSWMSKNKNDPNYELIL